MHYNSVRLHHAIDRALQQVYVRGRGELEVVPPLAPLCDALDNTETL
jgi:hypothetical protein